MRSLSAFIALSIFFQFSSFSGYSQQSPEENESFDKLKLITAKMDSRNTVLSVKVGAPAKDTIEAILTHSIGWVVEKKTIRLEPGVNSFSFDMAQIAEGSYRMILRNQNSSWTASQVIKK